MVNRSVCELRCNALDVKKTQCASIIFRGRITAIQGRWPSLFQGTSQLLDPQKTPDCSVWSLSRNKYVKTGWATNACYSQLEMHSQLGMSCAVFCLPFCYCFVFIVLFETGTYYVDLG